MQLSPWWLALLALALTACQGAPPAPQPASKGPGALAAEALERGDYARAAEIYQRALAAEPESLPLHYGLGVSASYLDRRAEAVRELTWVLDRGDPSSPEVKAARRWLMSVGALPRRATATPTAAPDKDSKPGYASLRGQVLSGDTPQDAQPMKRIRLILMGQPDSPTRDERYNLRTDEDGNFWFHNVLPGPYKLTDVVAGPPRWRLRVELKPGEDMSLNLTPGNSARVRDDFQDRR